MIQLHHIAERKMLQKEVNVDEVFFRSSAYDGIYLHGANVLRRSKAKAILDDRVVNPYIIIVDNVNFYTIQEIGLDAFAMTTSYDLLYMFLQGFR